MPGKHRHQGLARSTQTIAEIDQQPVTIELAGEKIVLFRNGHDETAALLDRCPHCGAALSLGRVSENGCLECPYHGWTFDRDGACTHVPLNKPTEIKLVKLQVVSLPTRIIAGLVWVFTGKGEVAEPQLPDSLMRSTESYFIYHEVWNAHWTRVVDVMFQAIGQQCSFAVGIIKQLSVNQCRSS